MLWVNGKGGCYLRTVSIIFVGSLFLLLWGIPHPAQPQEENTCVSCHTSVKELVKITREIAAKSPPQKSTESKGEG